MFRFLKEKVDKFLNIFEPEDQKTLDQKNEELSPHLKSFGIPNLDEDEQQKLLFEIIDSYRVDSMTMVEAIGNFKDTYKKEDFRKKFGKRFSQNKSRIKKFVKKSLEEKQSFDYTLGILLSKISENWYDFFLENIEGEIIKPETLNGEVLTYGEKEEIKGFLEDEKLPVEEKAGLVLKTITDNINRNKYFEMVGKANRER
jgi:hypothetical protein